MQGNLKVRRASAPTTFANYPSGLGGGSRWCVRHFVLTATELVQKATDDASGGGSGSGTALGEGGAGGTHVDSFYIPLSTIHAVNVNPDGGRRTFGSFMSSSVRMLLAPMTGAVTSSATGAAAPAGATTTSGSTAGADGAHPPTLFSIELVGDSQEARPVLVFEADDAATARAWAQAISSRLDAPPETIILTKEEAGKNIGDTYDLGSSLGSGMSGVVKKIIRKSDGKAFAMKTVSLQQLTGKQLAALRNEIDLLRGLDHPHVCKLYEVYTEPGVCVRLVLELCEGGELFDRLHQKKRLDEAWVARLVFRMVGVLRYLHENSIAHRDLKLENWLFRSKKDDDEIVLIDFGLSHRYRPNEHMHKKVGTSYYVAPEVLQGDYVGVQADIWSLGVIVYMLLAGTAPFDGPDDDAILARIASHKPPNFETGAWRRISSEARDFVSRLLIVDPDQRLTAEKALVHPWVATQGRAAVAQTPHDISDEIYQNLHKFAGYSTLKRIAIEAVAFSLAHEDIKNLTDVFEGLDSNSDGFISFAGLKRGLMKHHTISEEECLRIFQALDADRTGRIHVSEFIAAALQEKYWNDEHALRSAFSTLTHGSESDFITVADLKAILGKNVSRERALEMIKAAELEDHGDEHKLSWREFLAFVRRDGDSNIQSAVASTKSPARATSLLDAAASAAARALGGVGVGHAGLGGGAASASDRTSGSWRG